MSETSYDVIVIGSGMSGLTSAAILAKEGKRVLVLEQHYRPGGFLHRFYRKGGLEFDVGFHYIGGVEQGQVLGRYLDYLGVRERLEFLPLDPEGYDELRFPDFSFTIPAGEARFKERLLATFPNERAAIDRYFKDIQSICDAFGFYRLRREQDLKAADHWLSMPLATYLNELTSDVRLRAVLTGQNPLYGVEPSRAPMGLHAVVTDSFMMSPYTLKGGGDALAGVMVDRVRELGGDVKLRRRVIEILVGDNRHVRGVVTQRGEVFSAPLVISCAHPKVTLRMLPEGVLRPGFRRRILGMEDGIGTLSLFVSTKADLSSYAGRNIYNFRSVDIERLYEARGRPHEFAFVTVPTAREGVTRTGMHQVIALGLLDWRHVQAWEDSETGKRSEEYEAFKHEQTQELLGLMQACVPELEGNVESVEAATPLTNRDYAASVNGAAYGLHHTVDQMGRYGVRPSLRVGGLFLTGQSVLMPGVCGVTISAFHTCSLILGSEYLLGKVNAAA